MRPSSSSAPATARPGDIIGTSRIATARAAAAHAQGSVPHSDTDADSGSGSGSDLSHSIGSDAFVHDKGPTSPTSPLAPYPPISPTDARSRAPEFYGFVAWTSTYLLFVLYLLWAFLPDAHILALGVSWYPNREWALLIPAYGMVLVLLTYFTYFALALAGTPSLADMRTITDSKAHLPPSATAARSLEGADFGQPEREDDHHDHDHDHDHDRDHDESAPPNDSGLHPRRARALARSDSSVNPYRAQLRPDAVPELYDIPLGMVNRVVYGPRPRRGPNSPVHPDPDLDNVS